MKKESGIAMLMAIITITILGILAAELVYQTQVYHRLVYNSIDQLRAQYLAKSGLKLAMLQIKATYAANNQVKKNNASDFIKPSDMERIWQTPIILPPPIIPEMDNDTREVIQKFSTALDIQGKIMIKIDGESDKLNINQLVWPFPNQKTAQADDEAIEKMKEAYAQTIDNLLDSKRSENDYFAEKYRYTQGKDLIQNILAWIDPNTPHNDDGGSKDSYYNNLNPPYSAKNAPLYSISELHMIKGFDDELVTLLSQSFTTMVTAGININTVSANILKVFIPSLTDQIAAKIVERRTNPVTGPFKNVDEFWNFLKDFADFTDAKQILDKLGVKLVTSESAYRVSITASSGNATRAWIARIGDGPPALPNPAISGTQNTQTGTPPATPTQGTNPTTQANDSNSDLRVVYLKAD